MVSYRAFEQLTLSDEITRSRRVPVVVLVEIHVASAQLRPVILKICFYEIFKGIFTPVDPRELK